jgi:3'(2'), 5'-bisphosphate nucleotidase
VEYDKLAEVMRRLAIEAGALILEVYGRPEMETRAKADHSPVTEADEAADAHISAGLRAAFPDSPSSPRSRRRPTPRRAATFLIVDPLDGTKEFVQRRGDFTVNIALVEDGVPGARRRLRARRKGGMFYTDARPVGRGDRPLLARRAGRDAPIGVAMPDNRALRIVASKSHRDAATDAYISHYAASDIRSAGSSLKFCLVATGEADLYPRLGRTMEWDTAAGHAVLAGAGARSCASTTTRRSATASRASRTPSSSPMHPASGSPRLPA